MPTRKKAGKTRLTAVAGCVHKFAATGKKGIWTVDAVSTNNRGSTKRVEVPVTIFKCITCGETKEYPDVWESNYITPSRPAPTIRTPKKAVPKRPAKKALKA
jgi:hypothetical protein